MDGNLHATGTPMGRNYIARDPRTGKPIEMDRTTTNEVSYEPVQGPWSALVPADSLNLAEGRIDEKSVRWKNETLVMTKRDGIRALSLVTQGMIPTAHQLLLDAFQAEESDFRVAALEVLPEFAVRRSDELFDWLSVLLDDDNLAVRRAFSRCPSQQMCVEGIGSPHENLARCGSGSRGYAAARTGRLSAPTCCKIDQSHCVPKNFSGLGLGLLGLE